MKLLNDSRGKPSWTLTLGVPVTIVLTLKFAIGGIAYNGWTLASIDPIAYVTGITSVFTFIAQREWTEKKTNGNGGTNAGDSSKSIG